MSPPAEERWTVRELLATTASYLAGKGVPNARLDAELLLANVLACTRMRLYTGFDRPLEEAELARYRELVRRRAAREPAAYLLGEREFYGRPFAVSGAVLIPRPETELLLDAALEHARARAPDGEALRVLDLGTGSGCIAVTVACELPAARVVATDLSPEALEVARQNAGRHGAAGRIEFREGDLYASVAGESFDLVLSNPPYVPQDDPLLEEGVRRYEPGLALFAGADGLDVLRRIVAGVRDVLAPGGAAFIEIGHGQGAAVRALGAEAGFAGVAVRADAARIPRVLCLSQEAAGAPETPAEVTVEPLPEIRLAPPGAEDYPAPEDASDAADAEEARARLEAALDAYAEDEEEDSPPPA